MAHLRANDLYLYVIVGKVPQGLFCASMQRPTIHVVDDSSPWSKAKAQWRQTSTAMAALLALHQTQENSH